MGALSNKGGRGQRNREEIGAVFILLAASPLVRPARQNHHATQATPGLVSYRGLMQNFRQASQPLSYAESPPGLFTVISNALQRESEIKCYAARSMYFIFCGLGQVAQRTLERGRKYKEYREGSE